MTQNITATFEDTSWLLYDLGTPDKVFGKPSVIAVTADLGMFRIGSQVYRRDSDDQYQLVSGISRQDTFIDELANRHRHVAITTRRDFPRQYIDELNSRLMTGESEVLGPIQIVQIANGVLTNSSSTITMTDGSTDDSGSSEGTKSSATSVEDDPESESEMIDDIKIEDSNRYLPRVSRRAAIDVDEIEEDDPLLRSDSDSSGNSAEEEWSDGSSDALSDEIEDEDQWNDFGDDRLDIDDLELDEFYDIGNEAREKDILDIEDALSATSSVGRADFDEIWKAEEGKKIQISGFQFSPTGSDAESSEEDHDDASVESNYSLSHYSDSSIGSEDIGTAKHLDALIFGKGSREGKQRISLSVHDLNQQDSPSPTFHFTRYIQRGLFDSPPVFHPSKPLLVWPLGDLEVLFADYKENSFFTRSLCCSHFKACHVFIKTHFSSSGEYLHFAALEAQNTDEKDLEDKPILALSLQITTHRLSVRKTTRSPPRLVYRQTIDLDSVTSLNVSSSPYSLHWTDQELYFTTRAQTLSVMKIALFPSTSLLSERSRDGGVSHIKNDVYLPRTTLSRSLHFFPPPPPGSRAPSARVPSRRIGTKSGKIPTSNFQPHLQHENMFKILIGSHSSIPALKMLVPCYQVSPPIGVFLHGEKDLGGWKCGAGVGADGKRLRLNNAGGRLQGRFEVFNMDDDCDIIPFLH